MSELDDILKAPLEGDEGIRDLLILTLLTVSSFLIIPIFTLAGYYAKTANHNGKGIPRLENYVDLTITGFKVLFSHVLLGILVLIVAVATAAVLNLGINEDTAATIALVIALPVYFLVFSLTVQIGKRDRFRDILQRETLDKALTTDYLKALAAVLGTRIAFFFAAMIAIFTMLGVLLLPLLHVYRKLVAWKLVGYFYNREN